MTDDGALDGADGYVSVGIHVIHRNAHSSYVGFGRLEEKDEFSQGGRGH